MNVREQATVLATQLSEMTDALSRASKRIEHLEEIAARATTRLARGTMHPTVAAEPPAAPTPPAATHAPGVDPTALERALRAAPCSAADAASLLGVPVARVAAALRPLRRSGAVANAGTHDDPRWCWVLGDGCSTDDLVARVEQVCRLRPASLRDLVAVTGARRNRVSGALVLLRRHGARLVNAGNGWRALWSIPDRRGRGSLG